MAKKTDDVQPKSSDDVLDKAMRRFRDSWDYQKGHWHSKWQRDNKLYDNERVDATYVGVTDTFVPMTFSTIETMVAALNNASLRFDFKSNDPMRQASAAPLNALIDEWWDDDQWDLALEEGSREALITGMAANMFSWDVDHPHLEHFAMKDAILDPTIRNPRDLQQPGAYAGRRYLIRKGALDDYMVVDTDEKSKTYGELVKRYNMPREDSSNPAKGDEEDDKTAKERLEGSTLSRAKDAQDEIIEIWDIDRVVTVLNRKHVIENVENPYKSRHRIMLRAQYNQEADQALGNAQTPEDAIKAQPQAADIEKRANTDAKGLVPFFFLRNYRKTSLFYAKSEIDAIAKEQELLNDMTNMETDYIIRQLSPQKELDPKYADWIDLISNDPDVVYPFAPGSLVDRQVPVLPANSFNNRMNIKNEMRETTALDQLAKGVANIKDTTATEVNAQLEQTSQRIESKARIWEKDGLYWMAYIVFRMFQLYVDQPLVVEVTGADVKDLVTTWNGQQLPEGGAVLDPADYQGTWRPKVTLEIDANKRKVEERQQNTQAYQIMIQDPTNNLSEIKQRLYPKMFDLTKDDIQAIITPDPSQQMAMAAPGMAPAGAPPVGGAVLPPGAPGV